MLAGLENNLAVVAEFLGVRCLCQTHQGLTLCSWVSSLTVGLDRGSLHCPSRPLLVSLLPPGPCAGGSDSPEGPCDDRMVAQECPVFYFVKVKQYSALMTQQPLLHSGAPFPELSQEHTPPSWLPLWGCCCFIPLLLCDRSHQYCRLVYSAVKEEMGIFALVSHSCYFQLQMENRMSTVMLLCHCWDNVSVLSAAAVALVREWPCPVSVAGLTSWLLNPFCNIWFKFNK